MGIRWRIQSWVYRPHRSVNADREFRKLETTVDPAIRAPMSPSLKKVVGIALLFAFWLGTDLWSKHWADATLADPFHPQAVRISAAEAGKTLKEVVQKRLELPRRR